MSPRSVSPPAGVHYNTVLTLIPGLCVAPAVSSRVLHKTELTADTSRKWGPQASCTDVQRATNLGDPMTSFSLIIHWKDSQERAILTIIAFIIKDTHRAKSGRVLNAELPGPSPVESGPITLLARQHFQPGAPLSLGVQNLSGDFSA